MPHCLLMPVLIGSCDLQPKSYDMELLLERSPGGQRPYSCNHV